VSAGGVSAGGVSAGGVSAGGVSADRDWWAQVSAREHKLTKQKKKKGQQEQDS
jgi:hypothetical protein